MNALNAFLYSLFPLSSRRTLIYMLSVYTYRRISVLGTSLTLTRISCKNLAAALVRYQQFSACVSQLLPDYSAPRGLVRDRRRGEYNFFYYNLFHSQHAFALFSELHFYSLFDYMKFHSIFISFQRVTSPREKA